MVNMFVSCLGLLPNIFIALWGAKDETDDALWEDKSDGWWTGTFLYRICVPKHFIGMFINIPK